MSSRDFLAWRLQGDDLTEVPERVVEEGPLSVRVNGKPFTVTLRTPGDDRALVLGLLYSEGLIEKADDLLSLYEDAPGAAEADLPEGAATWSAYVKNLPSLDAKLSNRSLVSTSSCGFCGKTEWNENLSCAAEGTESSGSEKPKLTTGFLKACFETMQARQGLFDATGGSHAAALFSVRGELLGFGEDAGRHNAVDKAVGRLWSAGSLDRAKVLCVSGRVSYEIASKAARAGVTVLAAVSAPSSLAVTYCRDHNITLIGFCRGPRATVYACPQRVKAFQETHHEH